MPAAVRTIGIFSKCFDRSSFKTYFYILQKLEYEIKMINPIVLLLEVLI
jgi:hypothetical protein